MSFIRIVIFDFKNILHNPTLVIVNTVLPLIMIAVMGFVTTGGYGSMGVSSYDYYGVTMMIFTAMMLCMTATNTFMEEKVKSGNTRVVFAPVTKSEIILPKLIATYIFGAICFAVIMIAGQFLFHINFGGAYLFYSIVLIVFLALFGSAFGTMFCCIFHSEEGANGIMQIFIALMVFFGGVFFPLASLGKVVESLSLVSPIRWVTQCAFGIIYDRNLNLLLPVCLMLLIGSVICAIVSEILYKPEEYV